MKALDNETHQIFQEILVAMDEKKYVLNIDNISILDVIEYIKFKRTLEGHEYYTAYEWITNTEQYYPENLVKVLK